MTPCHDYHARYMPVSPNRGPQHRPRNAIILMMSTAKRRPQLWETPISIVMYLTLSSVTAAQDEPFNGADLRPNATREVILMKILTIRVSRVMKVIIVIII